MSPYYNFILNMWIMRKIDEDYVQSKVPLRISQLEANMILATPQMTEVQLSELI